MIRRRAALLVALPLAALAQPGPAAIAGGRPVRLIVPLAPGGAVDMLARLMAERLKPVLGNDVVVENRGGAGGTIGMEAVARAVPDGTTIGLGAVTTLVANRFLYARLPYDPARDFTLITRVVTGTILCVVNAGTARARGWHDFRALIAWARANPGRVRMGSSGIGTSSHFMIELVKARTGADILHAPYRGGGPALSDLLAGTIDMMFDVMPALMPHVEAGRLIPLAVGSGDRVPILPAVPGMKEFADLGLADVEFQSWVAVIAPAGLPPPVTARLFEAVTETMRDPTMVGRLAPVGYSVVLDASPAALAAHVEAEVPRWEQIVRLSGARVE